MIKILYCSFESLPFVKTGGLGDVMYALPKAINKKEYDRKVVIPLFKNVKKTYGNKLKLVKEFTLKSGYINELIKIYFLKNEGVDYLFIDNDTFFNRDGIYGYQDDPIRFSLYCLAVVKMLEELDYYPDIIHAHDYHTALISAICKLKYKDNNKINKIKHVFTIHNLSYQGQFDKQILFDYLDFNYKDYENGDLRFNDSCNFMKIGIIYADIITTVSKTYAKEIQTKEYGYGLDSVLRYRKDKIYGIVNGIDTVSFNPLKDTCIKENYGLSTYSKAKLINKVALQEALGLQVDSSTMLIGMVSRLTYQKGIDLVLESIETMMKYPNVQVALLGTGESNYEYEFKMISKKYPTRISYYCGYSEQRARMMYAGLDMLLMPSKFEPCGISQLIAMRYGTLPLVRETGGLKDTVEPLNEYENLGNGFSFGPYSSHDLLAVFKYAYDTYFNYPKRWQMLVKNAMKKDVSFKASAKEYESLYQKLEGDKQ